MIKNNFNAQGYKAPVCKVVRVAMRTQILDASPVFGAYDEAGDTVTETEGNTYNW